MAPADGDRVRADAARLAEQAPKRDGLEFLRAVISGELPPMPLFVALGIRFASAEHGRMEVELPAPSPLHYNPTGTMAGGIHSLLLDTVTGGAVQSLLPAGVGYTSLDLTVKFLRPVTEETGRAGPLRAVGSVVHLGRRTALAEARLLDGDERLCATAVSTVLILRPER
jgi:uncharacterized protein (TIGR00369 family)